ncbi:hypothetical protein F7725_025621 [Dissostichus mawsoni]|uniref:Uncharacterized protein n=1 Tax=Dissostichus mawsoni TaxID=36200 RepID=A0A7J5XCY3_DISMA|nr:hypothetical protein F7725_025621 [Dissostichus mawsoni]
MVCVCVCVCVCVGVCRCNVQGQEDRRVLALELDKERHALFVAFSSCVIRVPLSRCSQHGVCRRACLASRDPYCIWLRTGSCANMAPDALKEVGGTNQFEIFISHLYSLYNQSTRNFRLLKEAAAELNMEILKIGQIFTIRWVASSFKTVKAVWKDFPALALHFKTSSENASRNDLERQKYKGLLKHLTNSGFVEDLAVMKDILRELQSLSLKLQRREMTLVDSSVHIKQTINVLTAMKTTGGRSSAGFEQDIEGDHLFHQDSCHVNVLATVRNQESAADSAYGVRGFPELEHAAANVHYTLLLACVLVAFSLGAILSGFLVSWYCSRSATQQARRMGKDPEVPHTLSLQSLAKLNRLLDGQKKCLSQGDGGLSQGDGGLSQGDGGLSQGDGGLSQGDGDLSGLPTPVSTPELPIKNMKALRHHQYERNQNCNNAADSSHKPTPCGSTSSLGFMAVVRNSMTQQVFPFSHHHGNSLNNVAAHGNDLFNFTASAR